MPILHSGKFGSNCIRIHHIGSPSIPPERLLKSQVLIAVYSVRSGQPFCETLDYKILFRGLLDMELEEPSFDGPTFSKNCERLASEDVALRFFYAIGRHARALEPLTVPAGPRLWD